MVGKRKLKTAYKIFKKLGKAVVVLVSVVLALLLLVIALLFWEDLWQLVKPLVDEVWPYLQDLAQSAVDTIFEQ